MDLVTTVEAELSAGAAADEAGARDLHPYFPSLKYLGFEIYTSSRSGVLMTANQKHAWIREFTVK